MVSFLYHALHFSALLHPMTIASDLRWSI